jgi:phage terminase small subunit
MANENMKKAEELFKKGMKPIDIAKKLDIPPGTVRRWKSEQKWGDNSERSEKLKSVRKEKENKKKRNIESDIDLVSDNDDLNEKQKLFCLYYIRSFNATKSYQKAYGCSYDAAMVNGSDMLRIAKIRDQIKKLKQNRLNRELLSEEDIFQKFMDIAFSDITDYTKFGKREITYYDKKGNERTANVNYVDINNCDEVDGTLITEISEGKEGVKVKLADRMKALEWLANHMDLATAEQKARIKVLEKQAGANDNEDDETGVVILSPVIEDTEDGVIEGGGEDG